MLKNVVVAKVLRMHGLQGSVLIELYLDPGDQTLFFLKKLGALSCQQLGEDTLSIQTLRARGNSQSYATFANLSTREQAQSLQGQDLYVPRSRLPRLESGYYLHDCLKAKVYTQTSPHKTDLLGIVARIEDYGATPILCIALKNLDNKGNEASEKEMLVPLDDAIIDRRHLAEGRLMLDFAFFKSWSEGKTTERKTTERKTSERKAIGE